MLNRIPPRPVPFTKIGEATPARKPYFIDLIAQVALGSTGTVESLREQHAERFDREMKRYHEEVIVTLSPLAGVRDEVVDAMIAYNPVRREDAEAVLRAFGKLIDQVLTVESVNIALLSPQQTLTFMELRNRHHFDIEALATSALVTPDIVVRILINDPVPREYAMLVLAAYNAQFSTEYPIEAIDLKFTAW